MKPSLLIVDDEPSILTLMDRVLTKQGYEVQTCSSVEKAVQILKESDFDLILIDLYLKGKMNGFELMSWINENKPYIIKIVLSGTTRIEDVVKAVYYGAYDFVLKRLILGTLFLHQIIVLSEQKKIKEYKEQLAKNPKKEYRIIEQNCRIGIGLSISSSADRKYFSKTCKKQNESKSLTPKIVPGIDKNISSSVQYIFYKSNRRRFNCIFSIRRESKWHYIEILSGHGNGSALVTTFLNMPSSQNISKCWRN
jgi:CheY-like chemotaxis protein